MRKKFTYLISLAVAMICSSGGVAWGQKYIGYGYWFDPSLPTNISLSAVTGWTYVPVGGVGGGSTNVAGALSGATLTGSAESTKTPALLYNNENSTVVAGANGVNNQFGAGETSTIKGTRDVNDLNLQNPNYTPTLNGCGIDSVLWPGAERQIDAPQTRIHIGSTDPTGKNIVINSYDGGGLIQGWAYATEKYGTNTGSAINCGSSPSEDDVCGNIWDPSANTINNGNNNTLHNGSSLTYGYKHNKFKFTNSTCCASVSDSCYFSAWKTFAPYVTDQNTSDNDINLVQTVGDQVKDDATFNTKGSVKTVDASLDLYVRPTTVAIQGNATLQDIIFDPLTWWYNTYVTQQEDTTVTLGDGVNCCVNNATHGSSYDCGDDGYGNPDEYTYTRTGCKGIVSSKYVYHDVWYKEETKASGVYLDAAAQIVGNANVYVAGDITDNTGTLQSATGYAYNDAAKTTKQTGWDKTDALLVFPQTKKFELRVGHNINAINMIHDEADNHPTTARGNNIWYRAEDFPTTTVQNKGNNGKIFLYKNSVLGVNGTYDHLRNAQIHTESVPASLTDKGMIEVGTNTVSSSSATDGSFYVYSGSWLKNMTNLYCLYGCEQINLSATNAPLLMITNAADTVHIVNENITCCDLGGSINFKDAAAEAMLNNAFSNATADGPLEVHANWGSVNFEENITGLTATTKKNNFSIISDASYIRTKNFIYTTEDGWLLMHTNQDTACDHSQINMNGKVELNSTGAAAVINFINNYTNISGQSTTYPYYNRNSERIANYGWDQRTQSYPTTPTIVTVQGDTCLNDVFENGLTNAGLVRTTVNNGHRIVEAAPNAHSGDTLNNFQFGFRASECSIFMKSLKLNTVDGGLLVQALGDKGDGTVLIGTNATADVLDLTTTGNADVAIQSVQDSVFIGQAGNAGTHKYSATGMEGDLLISGHTGVLIHGEKFTTTPEGNQDIAIVSEYGPVLMDAENIHTQGKTGHYLVYGYSWVDFVQNDTVKMQANTTTPDYAKIWSPAGWIRNRKEFNYTTGGTYVPLTILAEGGTHLDGKPISGVGGSVSFDGPVVITEPTPSFGTTQIQSKNDNVNIKNDFTYNSPEATKEQNGQIMIQAGTDIFAADTTTGITNPSQYTDGNYPAAFVSGAPNAKKLTFNHYGEGQIIMEAHRNIELWSKFIVNQTTTNSGELTMKAGYKGVDRCGNDFTDTTYIRIPGNLTDYNGGYSQTCGNAYGNIYFNDSADINYDVAGFATDTAATVINAFRSVFINHQFDYDTKATLLDENHSIDHKVTIDNLLRPIDAGNILVYAETGNVEAIERTPGVTDSIVILTPPATATPSVNITVAENTNNADIRIQAGRWQADPYEDPRGACADICRFDKDHGNILFNKPLNIDNWGSGFTILAAHRDIEFEKGAPSTFSHDNVAGAPASPSGLTDSATVLKAGRHIETHAKMWFKHESQDYIDGSIMLWAGSMDHPDGINTYGSGDFTCTDALCKATELGSALVQDSYVMTDTWNSSNFSNMSAGGSGNGSILLFAPLVIDYQYGDSLIYLRALNGNIESDPYLHGTYPGSAAIAINHDYASGNTKLEAIDIKLHDTISYVATQSAVTNPLMNGRFNMNAYDSILTRNVSYINTTDTGSVFITTAKYKNVDNNGCDVAYNCTGNAVGIHQGHIVLGYGADCTNDNVNDHITFDFSGNTNTIGANLHILAGFEGFEKNQITGKPNTANLFKESASADNAYHGYYVETDRGKAYGGNITFDFMKITMATGNAQVGGYTEMRTPNGNIWGKDSLQYHGINGNLLVDAGLGSLEDTARATRWGFGCPGGLEQTLNTQVPTTCAVPGLWRTGNIIMKGGSLNFGTPGTTDAGTGNAIFRTREGFIDTYDAFTVDSMKGDLLKYAGTLDAAKEKYNEWGDISERDFEYHPIAPKSGSVFYGADDNIMMNYGYSNYDQGTPSDGYLYGGVGQYDVQTIGARHALVEQNNPYYYTPYGPNNGYTNLCRAIYNVNEDGYMWYRHGVHGKNIWKNKLHLLYRTCHDTPSGSASCSPTTGECKTVDNHARDLYFNFDVDAANTDIMTGGLGIVAMNYIDMFTKFTYFGGQGSGMGTVPGMTTLHGEGVQGYGLYMKSLSLANGTVNSDVVEQRRATCLNCGGSEAYPIGGSGPIPTGSLATHEWTYIGFHDDARIYTEDQKGLIEAPVVEFFGHAELNPYKAPTNSANTLGSGNLTVKGDSLIFHDSAIFDGEHLLLLPYTTDAAHRNGDMRYGVINDLGTNTKYYRVYGKAITMEDRNTPIIEFGYQRCYEPKKAAWNAPNQRSMEDKENTPYVGGDIIVTCRDGYEFPIFNTIVANHARISFISDSIDSDGTITRNVVDAYIRTDLLRIRNNVEFYTDPTNSKFRRGTLKMTSLESMPSVHEPGIFPHHLHMEPGSELSIPGEDSLFVEMTTTVGGYGNIHEDIKVMPGGTIAPGLSSLMEGDCQTSYNQGKLTIHNLKIEPNGIFRISIGDDNMTCWNEYSQEYNGQCTQTDTLVVEDTIDMREKVYLKVLPKTEHVDEGCYLFLVYGDSTGISKEYVKNLVLDPNSLKYDDKYFGLDFSEPGKVYLCVTAFPMPDIQRYVSLPAVTGVTTTPSSGKNYVKGNQNFSFTASYAGAPLKVTAEGYYSHELRDLDYTAVVQPDGSYLYTIYQVVEPWTVQIGPEASTVGNEAIDGQRVWAYKNTLHINVDKSDIVSIYNLTGVLYKRVEVPEGNSKFTLDRGMYVVTLKDGSVYKIVIK